MRLRIAEVAPECRCPHPGLMRLIAVALAAAVAAGAADPTFLRRRLPDIQPQPDDLTANSQGASYRPAFGVGDGQANQLKGIARYGELTVESGGASAVVSYAAEEQIYYVLDGDGVLIYGDEKAPVKKDDFVYLPIGVRHGMANTSGKPVRVMAMGFKIPSGTKVAPTPRLMLANAGDVPFTTLASHGPTTQFKLLMGTTESKRDKLAAASQMVSLFLMDFAPGGTNIPHHHDMEEEIYYILRGRHGGRRRSRRQRRTLSGARRRCVLYPVECHGGILQRRPGGWGARFDFGGALALSISVRAGMTATVIL